MRYEGRTRYKNTRFRWTSIFNCKPAISCNRTVASLYLVVVVSIFESSCALKAEEALGSSGSMAKAQSAKGPSIVNVTSKLAGKMPPLAPSITLIKQKQARTALAHGIEKYRNGELAEADRFFRQAVILDPHNTDGFFNLGALAEGRGDLVAALSNYRAALHIKPEDAELKNAVQSVENQLSHSQFGQAGKTGDAGFSSINELPSSEFPHEAPAIGKVNALPVRPSDFHPLHANVLKQAFTFNTRLNGPPIAGVTPGNPYPVVGVTPRSNSPQLSVTPRPRHNTGAFTRGALRVIMSVGLGYAAGGALRCPVCRVLGGF